MYNDAGPTVFLPDEIAAFYQIGMKKEAAHLFKRTIRGANKLDMISIDTLFNLGLVDEARDLLRRTARYVTEAEYGALRALRKKVTCRAWINRRVSRAFRN